jgi:hypothetical protein
MSKSISNLDRDIREAAQLGYGVHYGRYKADHPSTAPEVDAGPPEATGTCAECGGVFVLRKGGQLYCSDVCKSRHNNREAYRRRHSLPPDAFRTEAE